MPSSSSETLAPPFEAPQSGVVQEFFNHQQQIGQAAGLRANPLRLLCEDEPCNASKTSIARTAGDTDALSAEDIEAERRSGMCEEMIQQEFFCDWSAALPGAIYGKEIEKARRDGRITSAMELARNALVNTSWDLGSPRHTVV
jgi:hypothetical protein